MRRSSQAEWPGRYRRSFRVGRRCTVNIGAAADCSDHYVWATLYSGSAGPTLDLILFPVSKFEEQFFQACDRGFGVGAARF
jgi:hypothetical protein